MYVILNNIDRISYFNSLRRMEKIINYDYDLNTSKRMEIIGTWNESIIIWMSESLVETIQRMIQSIKLSKYVLDNVNTAAIPQILPGMQIIVRKFDNDDHDYSDIINPNLFIRKDSDVISTYELIDSWRLYLKLLLTKLNINICMSIKTMVNDMDIKKYSENNEWFKKIKNED